mmetsp:Transcript_4905/g.15524  ORF Transcript_4905/g.15524 Transcript_4905/m.15524 type:complete len:203 (-) Transcript_4905:940-1548(-)
MPQQRFAEDEARGAGAEADVARLVRFKVDELNGAAESEGRPLRQLWRLAVRRVARRKVVAVAVVVGGVRLRIRLWAAPRLCRHGDPKPDAPLPFHFRHQRRRGLWQRRQDGLGDAPPDLLLGFIAFVEKRHVRKPLVRMVRLCGRGVLRREVVVRRVPRRARAVRREGINRRDRLSARLRRRLGAPLLFQALQSVNRRVAAE